jgi:hypothetical protein
MISISLLISQKTLAQEPGPENSIPINLEFPAPKETISEDGTHYASFTIEQYEKLVNIYAAYYALGDFVLTQNQLVLTLDLQINEYKQQVLLYEALNESFKEENKVLKTNYEVAKKSLSKSKKYGAIKTFTISALVGLATGVIGFGIGKAL